MTKSSHAIMYFHLDDYDWSYEASRHTCTTTTTTTFFSYPLARAFIAFDFTQWWQPFSILRSSIRSVPYTGFPLVFGLRVFSVDAAFLWYSIYILSLVILLTGRCCILLFMGEIWVLHTSFNTSLSYYHLARFLIFGRSRWSLSNISDTHSHKGHQVVR
jgi:hypothetical protein